MSRTRIPLLASDGGACQTPTAPASGHDVPDVSDVTQTNMLGLNVTMQCPLRCDFCCYNCHPKRTERMPVELALDLVTQGAELGVFSAVGFTGGEPLLWLDELLVVGDALRDLGLPFTVVSAGHWAADPAEARRIVDALVDRGLYRLGLSTDPSHARFVPPAAVVNAALAAHDRGIRVEVVGAFSDVDDTLEAFVPDLVGLTDVELGTRFVAPAGRGRKLAVAVEHEHAYEADQLRCYRPIYHDLLFYDDGDAYPCCSVFNRSTDGIKLGNAYQDSVRTLWERAEGSLLLRVMKRVGFQHLYAIVEELDPALHRRLPPLNPTGGPCLLCNRIFSDLDLARDIRSVFVTYEQRTIATLLASMEGELGAAEAANVVRSAIRQPTEGAVSDQ